MARSALIAVLLIIAGSSLASAGQRHIHHNHVVHTGRVVHHQPMVVSRRSGQGFFSNLMELERRKNAWLKRTFLGM